MAFRVLVLAVAAGLVLFGATQLPGVKIDTLPEFGPPQVAIQTEALGLSAIEVEQLITVPLEADLLNGVAWLDQIRSESVPGLSSIEMVFEPGTDVMQARQVVAERLTQTRALPNVSKPPAMLQPLSSTSRVMMVGLSSDDLSLMDLSVLARWKIKPRLTGVPGVANVAIWGLRERQLQVQVDPERLRDNGVTLVQVMKTTGNALWVSPLSFVEASTPGSGGFIETPNQRMSVQHISPISTAADLAKVTVEDTGDRTLRLGDVATVVESSQPLIGDAVVDDAPSLMLVIEKFPGASTLEVTRGLDAAFAALAPGLPGVVVDTSLYRPASTIESALATFGVALLVGMALLVLLLGAFFFEWRATVISAVTIPLSLMAAALVLHLGDATFNVMTAAGLLLALGVVLDDTVASVDNIVRRIREAREAPAEKSMGTVVTEATLEVQGPNAFATLIVMVAATPLLFLDELTGAFARPLLLTYVLALLVSALLGLTLTPVLALLLLTRRPLRSRESPVVGWLQDRYAGVLSRAVRTARPAHAIVGLAALGCLALVPVLGAPAVVPPLREPVVLIQWDGAPGTSHPEMARISAAATSELRAQPGVRSVGGHVGRAITSDQVVNVNSGDLWVTLEPDADYDTTLAAIQDVVSGYPGLLREVQTYPEEQIRRAQTGTDDDLVVRIFGQDPGVLGAKAEEVRALLDRIDSVDASRVEVPAEEPTVEIEVDLDAAAQHGIKPGDVRRGAATLVSGVGVGSLFEDQKVFDVVVWGTPEIRHSVTDLSDLLIDKPAGGQVRLGDVAEVTVTGSPRVIMRDSVSRRVDVSADVAGRDRSAVLADVAAALRGVEFAAEYHAEILDEDSDDGSQHALSLAIAGAIGVFLLLQLGLGSWRLAAIVFAALPVALVGGLLAAALDGGAFTVAATAGLLTVLGVALRSVLVLVREYERVRQEPGADSDRNVVLRTSAQRLGPIMMTALGTMLVLVPLVVLGGAPGVEVVRPAAVVVLGGLFSSTVFSLLVVPALYLRFAPTYGRDSSWAPSDGSTAPHPEPTAPPREGGRHAAH